MNFLLKLLSSFKVGETGFAMVFDGENNLIYHPGDTAVLTHVSDMPLSRNLKVATGIQQVSGVVQPNSGTAEESTASAEELARQVQMMKNLVATFRLDDQFRRD